MEQPSVRILGLTLEYVADFRSRPNGKSAGLYAALDQRFGVVGIVRPTPSKLDTYAAKLRYFHPTRTVWRVQASVNSWMLARRSAIAERMLQEWDGKYDVIMQLHTLFAPGTRRPSRPYVLHTDNTYALSERYFPDWAPLRGRERANWLATEQAIYQNAAFLFPRSEFLRRSMIDDYGCDPDRVIRVGGGANLHVSSVADKRYDRQVAIMVGSDFERKGGQALLAAWPLVRRVLPEAQLWIVGPKQPVGEPHAGVHWHGFVGDRGALAQMYADATVFVMPSLFEPWGHVFFEAMAYGLPCIGSNHGATPEIVQDGSTGLLVPSGEPEPLAEALIALLGDPSRAAEMGRKAHSEVLHGHTWNDVVARMAPYIELAAGSRRRAPVEAGIVV